MRMKRGVRATAQTTRRGYRYWAAAVTVVAGLSMPTAAGAAPLGWSFDSGNLYWYVGQDYTTPPLSGNWSPTGGNPDGYVPGTDSAAETGCPGLPCNLLTFAYGYAPAPSFPGGLLDKYGGSLSLDFNSSVNPVHPLDIEIISSSGDAVVTDVSVPGTGWQHLSVPLTETNWDYCAATCAPATAVQMKCVLAEADALHLIADLDSPSGTGETYGIDNVLFTDGPPTSLPAECGPPAPPAASPADVPPPTCGGEQATIVGTNGNDARKGTPREDVIVGLGGNDTLSGLAGNDLICGGAGKDTLKGGKGNDKLYGESGKDTLNGGPGRDKLKGGAGKDKQVQ